MIKYTRMPGAPQVDLWRQQDRQDCDAAVAQSRDTCPVSFRLWITAPRDAVTRINLVFHQQDRGIRPCGLQINTAAMSGALMWGLLLHGYNPVSRVSKSPTSQSPW